MDGSTRMDPLGSGVRSPRGGETRMCDASTLEVERGTRKGNRKEWLDRYQLHAFEDVEDRIRWHTRRHPSRKSRERSMRGTFIMNGYFAAIALLLALPEESLQGWSKKSETTVSPPAAPTTTIPPPSCSKYTTDSPLFSWFKRFLEVFLSGRREAEPGERQGGLIIGGSPATIAEAPWLAFVSITLSGVLYECTGSIIDELYVMTAAHCVKKGSVSASAMSVNVGNADQTLGTTYTAKSWLAHPSYTDFAKGHDIAVIKLNQALIISPSVQPICVPKSNSLCDAGACPAKIFGWGRTTETPALRSLVVQKLEVTGDSGGRLVVYVGSLADVMGVDSYHQGSCAQYPSRYIWDTANVDFISTEVTNG
ncbi:unnamed protein product [Darwinula stevensoni]|uniref:Peptidase S1 domain-containing protein n=1 Tax=Darwinula stevensoni TaxID=69355 RepID=A0A7R8X8T6_9CRUS|nr:unnamed protein product [Darwinula stevensoni]CAG0890449.1 unnamed protein product [Darwinula stevensoni]